jgi:hypothetical protein
MEDNFEEMYNARDREPRSAIYILSNDGTCERHAYYWPSNKHAHPHFDQLFKWIEAVDSTSFGDFAILGSKEITCSAAVVYEDKTVEIFKNRQPLFEPKIEMKGTGEILFRDIGILIDMFPYMGKRED